jgi:hypothetical protein
VCQYILVYSDMYNHSDHLSDTGVWEGNYSTGYKRVALTSYGKNWVLTMLHETKRITTTPYLEIKGLDR